MSLPQLADLESAAEIVHRFMPPTPQICWPLLCQRVGTEVWVKHENHTPIGAFKLRGGLVYMNELRLGNPSVRAVITATRGNHGQSVALAASRCGLRAVIVVPYGNSTEKDAAMRALGAELIEFGHDFQEAYEHALALAKAQDLLFVPTFADPLVRGVASYALELFRGVPDLDTVYVPIGQGSGICGLIAARNALTLKTEIVGVIASGAPAYALSFQAGKPVSHPAKTIADGVACRVPDPNALEIILKGAARIIAVSEEQIRESIRHLFSDTHNAAEGAGALPLAALLMERNKMCGRRVGLILSGGNIDRAVFAKILADTNPLVLPARGALL